MNVDGKETVNFGIVLYDTPSHDISLMEKSLDSLLVATNNYCKSKVGVMMSFVAGTRKISETLHLSNFYSTEGVWCRGCDQSKDLDNEKRETEIFQQLFFAHFFISMQSGQTLDPMFFSNVDKIVNAQEKEFVVFENNGIYALLKSAVRSYYFNDQCGSYKKTESFLIDESKSRGLYRSL